MSDHATYRAVSAVVQGLSVSGSAGSSGSQGLQSLCRAVVQGLQSLSCRSGVPGKALGGRLKLDKLKEFNGFLAPHSHGWGVKQ